MASVGSSLVSSLSPDALANPAIYNISLPLANTEVQHDFPAGIKQFAFQNRDIGLVKVRTTSGGPYWTIFSGQPYYVQVLNYSVGVTLYFESPKAAQTLEIWVWS